MIFLAGNSSSELYIYLYIEKNVLIKLTKIKKSILMRTNKISIYDKQKFCPFSLKYFFIGLFY